MSGQVTSSQTSGRAFFTARRGSFFRSYMKFSRTKNVLFWGTVLSVNEFYFLSKVFKTISMINFFFILRWLVLFSALHPSDWSSRLSQALADLLRPSRMPCSRPHQLLGHHGASSLPLHPGLDLGRTDRLRWELKLLDRYRCHTITILRPT